MVDWNAKNVGIGAVVLKQRISTTRAIVPSQKPSTVKQARVKKPSKKPHQIEATKAVEEPELVSGSARAIRHRPNARRDSLPRFEPRRLRAARDRLTQQLQAQTTWNTAHDQQSSSLRNERQGRDLAMQASQQATRSRDAAGYADTAADRRSARTLSASATAAGSDTTPALFAGRSAAAKQTSAGRCQPATNAETTRSDSTPTDPVAQAAGATRSKQPTKQRRKLTGALALRQSRHAPCRQRRDRHPLPLADQLGLGGCRA